MLSITLEDVLHLTRLPIVGPAIANAPKASDTFAKVFGLRSDSRCPIAKMSGVARDRNRDTDVRIKAVLLILMACFVVPTGDGHRIKADCVGYIDDLTKVESYVWGAALLAYLRHGIRKWKKLENSKPFMDGNFWIVLAFFLIRIPGLKKVMGMKVNHDSTMPLIVKYVEAMGEISQNNTLSYEKVREFLSNLTDEDIIWPPYVGLSSRLPEKLRSQEKYGLLLSPICFMNYLVYHKPHLAPKQFPRLEGVQLGQLAWMEAPLKFKDDKGSFPQNFEAIYEEELKDWHNLKLVTDFLPAVSMTKDVVKVMQD